jgi:hypothetical protein
MSLQGTWIIWNQWQGAPPYRFRAEFSADGRITVAGGFIGTWVQLGTSSQVSLAIANCQRTPSITSYNGNVVGYAMGGEMTGVGSRGTAVRGQWVAHHVLLLEAEEAELREPGE